MQDAYRILEEVVKSYEPDRLSEEVVESLRFMLRHPSFAPIRDVIADKLIDIGEYFQKKSERIVKTTLEGKPITTPTRPSRPTDNRKKKKTQTNAASSNEPAMTMDFVQTREGILVPLKK